MIEMYYFLTQIYSFIFDLKETIIFTPYYFSDSHPLYNPSDRVEFSNCISGGEYCASSSDIKLQDPRAILLENIRQKCIYKHEPNKYFDYLREFYSGCLKANPIAFNKKLLF